MDKNQIIAISVVGVVVLAGGIWFLSQRSSSTPVQTESTQATPLRQDSVGQAEDSSPSATEAKVKEFTVNGSNYKFDPVEIRVKVGDKVKLTFKNSGGIHDLKIDELGVATRRLDSGESETVEFTAPKAGSFEYYCSVAIHRTLGMKGQLIVE